jgi:hypothetical protein
MATTKLTLNKIYRLIRNEITQTWAAVSEIAKGRGTRASGINNVRAILTLL